MLPRTAYALSNSPISDTRDIVAVNTMYKTRICRNFRFTGRCKYGDKCIFAHVPEDMKDPRLMIENNFGRRFCKYSLGMCPYGERCIFPHKQSENNEEKRGHLPRENSVISNQSVDVDSRSKRWLYNNRMMVNSCTYDAKCNYAHGQADLRRSTPILSSESGNAWTAPMNLVKDTLSNEAQETTAYKQKLQTRMCLFKWKMNKKTVGIYADWIDEEPFVPCLASEQQ